MTEELCKRHPDVDPFLLKKWEKVFNAFFDRNASEEVDWGDFYLVTRTVREIYGAQSEQMTYAKDSLVTLWNRLLEIADKNKDEKISLDEWVTVLKHCDPKTEPKWFNDYMGYVFKLFDVSADNKLDLAEYTDGMMAYGFKSEDAHTAFHAFCVDNNGKSIPDVSFPRYKELWHDYFYATDKKKVGNHIFGVMKDE